MKKEEVNEEGRGIRMKGKRNEVVEEEIEE